MSDQDNQSALAGALEQGGGTPAASSPQASSGSDGMTVTLPNGDRIELGQNYGQGKPFVPKRQ